MAKIGNNRLWEVKVTFNDVNTTYYFSHKHALMASIQTTYSKVLDQIVIDDHPMRVTVTRNGKLEIDASYTNVCINVEDEPIHF